MSSTGLNTFGIPIDCMRNQNAVATLRQAADRLEKRIEAVKTIGTMENFWSTPINRVENGQITNEPFDPTLGVPYQSVAPIRLSIDPGPVYVDPLDPAGSRLKKAFIVYCDNAKKNGTELPKFNRRIDKLKFNLRHLLTGWGII